jgi:hypothetical protein
MQIVVLLEQLNALKDEFDTLSNTIQKNVIVSFYRLIRLWMKIFAPNAI